MKKDSAIYTFYFSVVACFLFFGMTAFAQTSVTPVPQVKININGTIRTYTDVPINANGRTLLPLRAVLVDLGVQNDNDHII